MDTASRRELMERLVATVEAAGPGAADAAFELGTLGIRLRGSSGVRGSMSRPALAVLDDAQAWLPALDTPDASLRSGVAMALGEWSGKAALGALAAALAREQDDGAAGYIVHALRTIGGPDALAALCDAIDAGRPAIRSAAVAAIEDLALGAHADMTTSREPRDIDADHADRLVRRLAEMSVNLDGVVRQRVVDLASRVGTATQRPDRAGEPVAVATRPAPEPVSDVVAPPEEDAGASREAARLLAVRGDGPEVAEAGFELARIRITARRTSGPRGSLSQPAPAAGDMAAWAGRLRSLDSAVRCGAAMALGEWAGEEVVGALTTALRAESDDLVSGYLVHALRTIGGPDAAWALAEAVEHRQPAAASASVAALEDLTLGAHVDVTSRSTPAALDPVLAGRLVDALGDVAPRLEGGPIRRRVSELITGIRAGAPDPKDRMLSNRVGEGLEQRCELAAAGRAYALRLAADACFDNIDIHLDASDDAPGLRSVARAFEVRSDAAPPILHMRDLHLPGSSQAVTEYLVAVGSGETRQYFVARPATPSTIGPRYRDASRAADLAKAASQLPADGEAAESGRPSKSGDPLAQARRALAAGRRTAALTALRKFEASENVPSKPAVKIELARMWSSLGDTDRAKNLYHEVWQGGRGDQESPRRLALVNYRLGELALGDDEVADALRYWKEAFDANDEQISPYAARNLAKLISTRLLPAERVLWLYLQAANSAHLDLSAQARFEYADFLARRHHYDAAREELAELRWYVEASVAARVDARLRLLDVEERAAPQYRPIDDAVNLEARSAARLIQRLTDAPDKRRGHRVVIVGAGVAGRYLFEALGRSPDPPIICGFVDDHPPQIVPGSLPVLGGTDELGSIIDVQSAEEVLLAIPTASGRLRRKILRQCWEADVPLCQLPSMYELELGWNKEEPKLLHQLRAVELHETLGDHPVKVDQEAIDWAQGSTAVVLGARDLGAEVCRRLADARVGELIVVDPDEAVLAHVANGLQRRDFQHVTTVHVDFLSGELLAHEIARRAPDMIFNASGITWQSAAERSLYSAIRDVRSAQIIADIAGERRVPTLVHVSDMRAEAKGEFAGMKRLAEDAVLSRAGQFSDTRFVAVRTRPVVGAAGSILTTTTADIQDARARGRGTIEVPRREVHLLSMTRAAELLLHVVRLSREHKGAALYALDGGAREDMKELADFMVRFARYRPEQVTVKRTRQAAAESSRISSGFALPGLPEILELDTPVPDADEIDAVITSLAEAPTRAVADGAMTAPVLIKQILRAYPARTARRAARL